MAIEVKVGDVFLIPLDGKKWACGQLIDNREGELYVAVFRDSLDSENDSYEKVILKEPLFLALTLDAKLWHGDWPIVGNVLGNLQRMPQPSFKVRQSGVVYIESRDRGIRRPATQAEVAILRYRSVSSPAVIEEAVQGYFGVCEWNPHYDKFHGDYAYESSNLI